MSITVYVFVYIAIQQNITLESVLCGTGAALSLILLASYFSHIITSCVHMDAMSLCLPAVPS